MNDTRSGTVSQKPLVPHPERLLQPSTLAQSWDFGVVSADTYPFFAPYRVVNTPSGEQHGPTGRVPRLLSAIFSTLIHYDDPCWNAETRVLEFRDGWSATTQTLRIYRSQPSRDAVDACLTKMRRFPVSSQRQCVAIEDVCIERGRRVPSSVTLTPEYAQACQRNLREVSFATMHDLTGSLELDLYVFAALYAPDDGRLRVTRRFLTRMLPGSSRRINSASQREQLFASLNTAQDRWTYTMSDDGDAVFITGRAAVELDESRTVSLG